jgi:hypothetical protein
MEVLGPQRPKCIGWIPFLADWICFHRMRKILQSRSEESVVNAWSEYGVAFREVKPICIAIATGGGWPSFLFIPDDKVKAIFFPDGDMGFESIGIVRELAKLAVMGDFDMIVKQLEERPNSTLGQLVWFCNALEKPKGSENKGVNQRFQ